MVITLLFPLKECLTNVFLILDLHSDGSFIVVGHYYFSNEIIFFPQSYSVGFPTIFIGSLSNEDGNKNGQNAIGLDAVYTDPDSF